MAAVARIQELLGGERLTGPLRTALDQTAFTAAASSVSIKIGRLSQWASACGATALVFEHFTTRGR